MIVYRPQNKDLHIKLDFPNAMHTYFKINIYYWIEVTLFILWKKNVQSKLVFSCIGIQSETEFVLQFLPFLLIEEKWGFFPMVIPCRSHISACVSTFVDCGD